MGVTLMGKMGEVEIGAETIAALQVKWKTRDVSAELQKAHLWLLRYERRRPENVWRFVDNWLKKAPATIMPTTVVNAWWTTDERTLNQGEAIGVRPRPGETMPQYRARLAEKMKAAA
jgi:hypothetical protein